nr:protein ZBED8-like [Parasteatoda tepidariorum]
MISEAARGYISKGVNLMRNFKIGNSPIDTPIAKKAQFLKSGALTNLGFGIPRKPLVEASLTVEYRIAKSKKPHTIGKTLIKPSALEIVELVCELEQTKKLEAIPLSNDVIHSRIVEISCNILKQIIVELKASSFFLSMQLDLELSTHILNCSQLFVFVRYLSLDTIKEEFLFCESPLQTTEAVDVLVMLNVFFTKHDFHWKEKLHSLCTDAAPAMLGNKSDFDLLVKKESPNDLVTHSYLPTFNPFKDDFPQCYILFYKEMPRLRGRARNIGRRTRNAQLVHDRGLNRTVEEHLTDNVNSRNQVINAINVFVQVHQDNERHANERVTKTENVTNGECKIIEH